MFHSIRYKEPVFRPPSEQHSLIIQITYGCSQNRCLFCGMYKNKSFKIRSVKKILSELRSIPVKKRSQIKRIFLADGDALIYPMEGLLYLLQSFQQLFPQLRRIGIYASPNSLKGKTSEELLKLKKHKINTLYFGLESGDEATLKNIQKGFNPIQMLHYCQKAQQVGLKLSVTAILGLAGQDRGMCHAQETSKWINLLSPRFFSLLTLIPRGNKEYLRMISLMTNGQLLEEALTIAETLAPTNTILRSNHVSNILHLSGTYPKDRKKIIKQAANALATAKSHPQWYNSLPESRGDMY